MFAVPRSIHEKDEKIKMVETLLEAGLIEMANKEEELQVRGSRGGVGIRLG